VTAPIACIRKTVKVQKSWHCDNQKPTATTSSQCKQHVNNLLEKHFSRQNTLILIWSALLSTISWLTPVTRPAMLNHPINTAKAIILDSGRYQAYIEKS